MTLAPGYETIVGDRGPASPDPGDVGALFIATLAEKGPVGTPVESRSLSQWRATFGGKVAWSDTDRVVEAFFREGGARIITSRAAGPAPVTGTLTLQNSTPADVLTINALGPGAYSANYKVTVTTESSDRRIKITRSGETILDDVFTSSATAKAAIDATGELEAEVEAGTWPVANLAETALSTGTDDYTNITTTEWVEALNSFDRDLGPGQVAVPGITSDAVRSALWEHADANNRFALSSLADGLSVAQMKTAAGLIRSTGRAAGVGLILAPWEQVEVSGATVSIPPEGSVAGRMARTDRTALEGPGQPAAGDYAVSLWSTGVAQEWSEDDREELNEAGIAVIRQMRTGVQLYGYRTPADPIALPAFVDANGMRVLMAIRAEHEAIISTFVLRSIDGNRHLLAELNGALVSNLTGWFARRALYGQTPAEAFSVDATSEAVNPPEQLAQRKIRSSALVQTTPFGERVELTITKIASGDTI